MKSSLKRWMSRAMCLLCAVWCALLLPALPAARAEEASTAAEPAPTVRVNLRRLGLTDRADLWLDGVYTIQTGGGTTLSFPRGSKITVQMRDAELYLFYEGMSLRAGNSVYLQQNRTDSQSTDGIRFEKNGNYYPGHLLLSASGESIRAVLAISVEDYLLGVVPYEMSDTFPLEALKAQAVCARTYALAHVSPSADWDVVDTTNDQVFRGINPLYQNAARAVQETAGVVGMYKGSLANCYYSASNGGQTELVENVWSGVGDWGYYAMVDDPYDLENPESIVRRATLNRSGAGLSGAFVEVLCNYMAPAMQRAGYVPDPEAFRVDSIDSIALVNPANDAPSRLMTGMTITFRWSGRKQVMPAAERTDGDFSLLATPAATALPTPEPIVTLSDYISAEEPATVTLELFPEVVDALKLNIGSMNNELITVTETDSAFVLESRRYGHGVGMSQRGAQWMAGRYAMTFDQILAFYYPGMTLMVAPSGPQVLPTPAANLVNTPAPAATATPRPTLMPVTEPLPEGAWLASVEGIEDDSSLNLRAEPSMASEIMMRLYKHQRLAVLERCEDEAWVHVKTDAAEGYVMVSFLERIEDGAAASTATPVLTPVPTATATPAPTAVPTETPAVTEPWSGEPEG